MPRSKTPIWTRPAPGTRKPKLTREQIGSCALSIADTEGFESVSMRRVAADLGVGTMTLYYYVQTKDDIVALMDDALMGEVLVPYALPGDWRLALSAIARRTRSVFLRHPWALLSLQGALPGPNGMRHFEQSLAALAHTSLDTPGKLELIALIDDFVFGNALRAGEESRARANATEETTAAVTEFAKAQMKTGHYPQILALWGDADPVEAAQQFAHQITSEERFERGLKMLLDGVSLRMEPSSSAIQPTVPAPKEGQKSKAKKK